MIDALAARTGSFAGDARTVRCAVLELFDRHATFEHLLEHHDGAERQGSFAALDEDPSAALDDGTDAWWTRRQTYDALAERARVLLDATS